MGQPRASRVAWWHAVTPVYTALVGAVPLLPPQLNMPRLPLRVLAPGTAVPGAPGLHPNKLDAASCPVPEGQCP